MGFDQKGTPVSCVAHGVSGQWDVSEERFEKPLASFNSSNCARENAEGLARTQEGSIIKMIGGDNDQRAANAGGASQ